MARQKKNGSIKFELVETDEPVKKTSAKGKTDLANSKKLSQYKQDKPIQLELFELLLPSEKPYSNTIELYDFIPKYHWGKVERVNGTFLKSLDREFECRGKKYNVKWSSPGGHKTHSPPLFFL